MINYYNNYTNKWEKHYCLKYYMVQNLPLFRRLRVNQERRRFLKDVQDEKYYGFKIRRKRNHTNLDPWGLIESQVSCIETKSWKKLYKKRKRYLIK